MGLRYKAGGRYPSARDRDTMNICPGCDSYQLLSCFVPYCFPGEDIAHLTVFCEDCDFVIRSSVTPPALHRGKVLGLPGQKNPQG